MHLDYQYYAGNSHQFLVGVAHGLTILASSLAPCCSDRESWSVTPLAQAAVSVQNPPSGSQTCFPGGWVR